MSLFEIRHLIVPVFLAAALIYVALRRSDGSRAKSWTIIALWILLFRNISGVLASMVIARNVAASEYAAFHAIYSIFASILYMIGYSFLIAAVFTGRKSNAPEVSRNSGGPGVSDENPYSASSL